MDHTSSPLDGDGNEIRPSQKFTGGFLIVAATLFCIVYIIGHWPDRLPGPKEDIQPFYRYEWFNVVLDTVRTQGAVPTDTGALSPLVASVPKGTGASSAQAASVPTGTAVRRTTADTATPSLPPAHSAGTVPHPTPGSAQKPPAGDFPRIHLNTLLLILVAFGGFLGNMLHIATSFTTFIGAGQFRKSWALWYWVKPFTAAGLALTLYFVFRGGFLNMNDTSVNINLYGVMTISILTGLFTDRATLKLKEVFEVLLRPKEDRPGALQPAIPKVREVKATPLAAGKPAHIMILGEHLKEGRVSLSIEGQKIEQFNLREDGISFFYVLPEALASLPFVTLSVKFGEEQTPASYQLIIAPQA